MTVFESTFFWIFLAFYFLHEFVHLGLEAVNYFHVKKQTDVPAFFQNYVTPGQFRKAKQYTLEKIRFSVVAHVAQIPFFWFLIFLNGFNTFDYYAAMHAGYGTLGHSVLFCVYVFLYFGIIHLPFKIYSIFEIEEKYGFNKMHFGLFLVDLVKGLIISAMIGIPLLFLTFWVMKATGSAWWLWAWAVLTLFQFVMVAIYPRVLAPVFNKFKPLKDDALAGRISELAQKIDFKLSGTYVMDGSRRSGHSNAFFAGMGRFRRIVLFDTLIDQLTADELIAVLAHEMGHNVKKHIRNFMVITSGLSLAGFYVLSLIIEWPDFYAAFNISEGSVHAALVVFVIVSETFTFVLTPLLNLISRHNEYEADRFSVAVTGDKSSMKSALIKLTRENLSNLTPHAAYSFYHYSHPTTLERVRAIDQLGRSDRVDPTDLVR